AARLARASMEALLLALVCLSPWALGSAGPVFELGLYAGVAVLLLLWAAVLLLEGRLTWVKNSVTLCLAGLFLLGTWQLTPLGRPGLEGVSPATARLYEELLPAEPEVLPLEEVREATRAGTTISLYPAATRARVIRLLAVFLVFVLVLNN